jgi:hypothetical protein
MITELEDCSLNFCVNEDSDDRVIRELNGTFGWELVVLHTTPSMFNRLLVHFWR